MKPNLIIVGAGAAGLMAAACAAERGLRVVLLERKHQPGRKLLMCGNNRCNITRQLDVEPMLADYGQPVADFLRAAIEALPPRELRQWFSQRGLVTQVQPDARVYPRSQKADDVLHLFTDQLRDRRVPVIYNCPVEAIRRTADGLMVACQSLELTAPALLLATGGVSYPKTGSVGDGQNFAKALGHSLVPYRPGLAAFEIDEPWLMAHQECSINDVRVTVTVGEKSVGESRGNLEVVRQGVAGKAIFDASRLVARHGLNDYRLLLDLCPDIAAPALAEALRQGLAATPRRNLPALLAERLLPLPFATDFLRHIAQVDAGRPNEAAILKTVSALKGWPLRHLRPRPLKEAMVTMGGVALAEIDSATMASTRCPGLYFAGEVMDVDGPTGGYNLHAAFATAQLAVAAIAANLGTSPAPRPAPKPAVSPRRQQRKYPPRHRR